tara:strand:- start:2781 stop:3548 length:768 start_codon:yes stop_codon:yes gene_type:complete
VKERIFSKVKPSKLIPKIVAGEKARRAFHRVSLHLAILIGAMSIAIEQIPNLFSPQTKIEMHAQKSKEDPDQLLKESIKESREGRGEKILAKALPSQEESKEVASLEDLLNKDFPGPVKQLVHSLSVDKLALWSVFSNLSSYGSLDEILSQPVKAYERETLRSENFSVASGFDQIVYRIHHVSGGTSMVVAQVQGESVVVSFYKAPLNPGEAYQVQVFQDGLWLEGSEMYTSQVEQSLQKHTGGSSVVLSASVGL